MARAGLCAQDNRVARPAAAAPGAAPSPHPAHPGRPAPSKPLRDTVPQTSALRGGPRCRRAPQFSAAPALAGRGLSPPPQPAFSSGSTLPGGGRPRVAPRHPSLKERSSEAREGVGGTHRPHLFYVHVSVPLAGEDSPREATARPWGPVRRLRDPSPKASLAPVQPNKMAAPVEAESAP